VITKKNQVEPDLLSLVQDEVSELVRGSRLEKAPILSVDSPAGDGIPELKEAMYQQIKQLDGTGRLIPSVRKVFRLPIDRVFSVKGFGTVVTGTLQGGEISENEAIAVYPEENAGKIRGIQIFGEQTSSAKAGQRTALNLIGLDKEALDRGMTLGSPKTLGSSTRFTGSIRLLETAPSTIGQRDPIRFHHGSSELIGRVRLLDRKELKRGDRAVVQIQLAAPAVCSPGDRFILRRYSPLTTIGGGMVLDIQPPKVGRKDLPEYLAKLSAIDSSLTATPQDYAPLIEYLVQREGALGTDLKRLVTLTGLEEAALEKILEGLDSILIVASDPPLVVGRQNISTLRTLIREYLEQFHARKPLAPGLPREELRKRFLPGSSGHYFQFLLETWVEERAVDVRGSYVAFHGSEARLTPAQDVIRGTILQIVEDSALSARTLAEIAAEMQETPEEVRDVFYYMLETGEVLRVSGEMVVAPRQVAHLKKRLREAFPPGTLFTVPEFKEMFSLSRKYAIPLLELLDREKVTRRQGDGRMVV
jgi:selenocysteine-specific elongation factor